MKLDGASSLFALGAFAAPLAASQLGSGNLDGRGQVIDRAGEIGTLRGLTLGAGIAAAIYAFASESRAATAIAVGLVGSAGAMYVMPERKRLGA